MMEKLALEELNRRVQELERLAWSIFRSLETYITFHELSAKEMPPEEENEQRGA